MHERPNVYSFHTFAELFGALVAWRRSESKQFTFRWLARELGLKSHTFLVRIAKGEQAPPTDLVEPLCGALTLNADETVFAKALHALQCAKSTTARRYCVEQLESLRGTRPAREIEPDFVEFLSQWHHLAIFEWLSLATVSQDPADVARRLKSRLTPAAVAESIERLVRLGLLAAGDDGRLMRMVDGITTTHKVPSAAIRAFHGQMLEVAQSALAGEPLERRCFLGHTMPFDRAKIDEAKALLLEFRNRFQQLLTGGEPTDIYQLGLYFIPLTEVAADERGS